MPREAHRGDGFVGRQNQIVLTNAQMKASGCYLPTGGQHLGSYILLAWRLEEGREANRSARGGLLLPPPRYDPHRSHRPDPIGPGLPATMRGMSQGLIHA